ncbi:MAG: phosphogluconate dehydratase [Brevundimonas sp.]|uniref:phosphogluconate dehydratase n=1 Tax=Brevundimonas sp. TaxID=1871086 RepID=UPI00391D67FB
MAASLNDTLAEVTARIEARSRDSRRAYEENMAAARREGPGRARLSCANWAHAFAGVEVGDRLRARATDAPNIGIITAYNDMLSAHQPLETYPTLIRDEARREGATAQVAGGVAAMCDGVTQGRAGMELSLFSRDVIAMSTAIALSHDAFDGALCLGVCDKIVPGLFMGAAAFGHLPVIFAPAGPMPSGIPNAQKAKVRALYAEGKVSRDELLESEIASYHSPGTCTFYGTANSNQMLMELMGLHLPGTAFVNPGTPLREALTRAAARRAVALAREGTAAMGEVMSARALVNGIVGLLATGGSTNHTLHLIAMARAIGLIVDWSDMDALSRVTPLMARVYPNGEADVNAFAAAGGLPFITRELLQAGLLHRDVTTVADGDLSAYTREPWLQGGELQWREGTARSLAPEIVSGVDHAFSATGGLRLVEGNLGRAVIKTSAVRPEHRSVRAPVRVFDDQESFLNAFREGRLDMDVVIVVRFQGPKANGMPELHSLSPPMAVLQERGFKVALVTDGRMSGASGRTAAAIHLSPEALDGGPLARIRDGDIARLDAEAGVLELEVPDLMSREPVRAPRFSPGLGRELFASMRSTVSAAEKGASVLFAP